MSKNNVRIAIRDSTDSHNVAFFDNKAGIKYKSANLHRFLAGSASILTLKYNSKDIDSIRSGCKLAFRYKNRDYWLNVMNFEKKGFEVELTAYSLGLELNNETRGEHKPANAMSITEYVAYYDPEHALTIGVNEVSDKRIKLEWTGTDTILARLFSVANSFGAELDFSVELNDDYSLKRQVLNIYKKGNLGTNKVSQPVRVGKELKVINYSDNIKELRTAVRATGKDGLTIDGLNKKIYDSNKQLLYYSSGMTVYAPQSRDRFPSVGKGSNDNWIVEDLGETQYETKEALWGYMYGEIQKKSLPEITYEVEGAIEAGIGDTQTLIDDIHFEPTLYVQARVSELEDDILTGKVTKSTFINFERKYSQIADVLLKQVEALAEDAAPYIIRLSTNNGYIFKNGEGSSTITARLEKYSKDIAATWKWVVDNKVVGTGDKLTVKAEQVTNTMAVTVIAYVNGNEVVRDYMTFSNSDDGVGVESIDRYFTSSDQSDGVTIEGAEWSDKPPAPTEDGKYLWAYDEITYTDGTVTTTKPAAVGANFDVDAFRAEIAEDLKDVPNREEFENKIAEELATSKAEIETQIETAKTQAESNAKEYADTINDETAKVAELANAAAAEIKADLVNVKNNLTDTSLVANNAQAAVDAAKQDLAAVNTKVDSAKAELAQAKQDLSEVASDLSTAKQDLTNHAQQLQTQANAQTELTKRVTTVETTANGTKTTVNELTKTVAQNGKDITSVTNRTKTVEDDLANTKTTLTQVQTTANSASQKTATLETGLNGLSAKFENLSVGTTNHFLDSAFETTIQKIGIFQNGNVYTPSIDTTEKYDGYNTLKIVCRDSAGVDNPKITYPALAKLKTVQQGKLPDIITISFWGKTNTNGMGLYTRLGYIDYVDSQNVTLTTDWKRYIVHVKTSSAATNEWLFKLSKAGTVWIAKPQFEFSAIASDYHLAEEDTSSKVAEYKQTADQNYARLQSNLQTLDGTVKQNKSEFDQTASQLRTTISAVEGKIPTNLDSLNLMTGTRDWSTKTNAWHMGANWSTEREEYQGLKVHSTQKGFNGSHQNIFVKNGDVVTFSFFAKATNTLSKIKVSSRWDGSSVYQAPLAGVRESDEQITITSEWKRYSKTVHITSDGSLQFRTEYDGATIPSGNTFYVAGLKLAKSSQDTGYSENPTDAASDITRLSSSLTQTANGLEQLSTKVTSQGNTINTHTTQISALNTGLNAKVSQSDFNTLSGRVTTAENNITAKANELSSKITSVEGKIPTTVGGRNYLHGTSDKYQTYTSTDYVLGFPSTNRDWAKLLDPLRGKTVTIRAYIKNDTNYPVRIQVWANIGGVNGNTVAPHSEGWSVGTGKMSSDWTSANVSFVQVGNGANNGGTIKAKEAKLEIGNIPSDWSPAPEDAITQINSVSSEFKQTTDAIKASVTSLDNSTVKSSSLTINSDGIVMKAGKSTTDVANAIGSYFSVNQNAINLFSDKINVKGNMIVNGAITSDKIASKQINTAHLNGKIITADVISSNAVTADAIRAGAVTTDKMSANSINGDRITAGTLDAAKIKAGSITASQIASGTITSNQIKAGGISSANIAAGAITGDKIAAGAIDANKIAANAITANMIRGGKLNSTNGATVFDLNAGTLTFNNNYGYIQRVAGDKIFEITTYLSTSSGSQEHLTSAFMVRKSDNSRQSGVKFTLYNTVENKPTAEAKINADALILYDSINTRLFSVHGKSTFAGGVNFQGWGDIPIAKVHGGLIVQDIGIGSHTKSLLKIVEELCKKAGILWV